MNPTADCDDWGCELDLAADSRWLREIAERILGDSTLADDACQEAWLAAERRHVLGQADRRSTLLRLMRRFAWRWRRSERRRAGREAGRAQRDGVPSTAELLERGEERRLLWQRLSELPEPFRSTLLLRFQEGLEVAAIAEHLGIARDTVRWRVRRGIEQLRRAYERDDRVSRTDRGGRRSLLVVAMPTAASARATAGAGIGAAIRSVVVGGEAWVRCWMASRMAWVGAGLVALTFLGLGGAWWLNAGPSVPALGPSVDVSHASGPATMEAAEADAAAPVAQRREASEPVTPPMGCRVFGRVVDRSDRPLAAARVRLIEGRSHWNAKPEWVVESTTDGAGRFELRMAGRQGRQRIRLVVDASPLHRLVTRVFGSGRGCQHPALEVDQFDVGTIAVSDGSVVTGRVIDVDGRPIARAWVDSDGGGLDRTDGSGRFRLEHVQPGSRELDVELAGYLAVEQAIELPTGRVTELADITLSVAPRVRGVVVGPTGQPLSGATISSHGFTRGWVFEADAAGRFDVPLPSAQSGRLIGRAPGHRQSSGLMVRPGAADVRLVLQPSPQRGRFVVVDADTDRPIEDLGVRVRGGHGSAAPAGTKRTGFGQPDTRRFANGTFRASGRIGVDAVFVRSPGYRSATVDIERAAFGEGGQRIELQPAPAIAGRLLGVDGQPAPGVEVTWTLCELGRVEDALRGGAAIPIDTDSPSAKLLRRQGGYTILSLHALDRPLPGLVASDWGRTGVMRTITDSAGTFRFPGGEPGRGRVFARLRENVIAMRDVVVDGRGGAALGDVRGRTAAEIRGRVVPSYPSDLSGTSVSLVDAPQKTVKVERDGSFRMTGLPSGGQRLRVRPGPSVYAPGVGLTEFYVRLEAGTTRELALPIPSAPICRLRVQLVVNGVECSAGSVDLRRPGERGAECSIELGTKEAGLAPAGLPLRMVAWLDDCSLEIETPITLPAGPFTHRIELGSAALELVVPASSVAGDSGLFRLDGRVGDEPRPKSLTVMVPDRKRVLPGPTDDTLRLLFAHVPTTWTRIELFAKNGAPYSRAPWRSVGVAPVELQPGATVTVRPQ